MWMERASERARGRETHRADEGLEEGRTMGVGNVHGLEEAPAGGVASGVAAAAAVVGAELERALQRHRRRCLFFVFLCF